MKISYNTSVSHNQINPNVTGKGLFYEAALLACLIFAVILAGHKNYLLFHSGIELFCVIIAYSITIIALNTFPLSKNNYFLLLGVAFFFVGFFDFIHLLSYKGMGVFPSGGANLPTQLWIISRYVEGSSFLLAPLFLRRKLNWKAAFVSYLGLSAALLAAVSRGAFPDCFVDGQGLTVFKKASEYIVAAIFMISLAILAKNKTSFHPRVCRLLAASFIATVLSELMFTLYTDVYGIMNMAGHVFKLISYYLFYRGLIETSLLEPQKLIYQKLDLGKEKLLKNYTKLEKEIKARTRTERELRAANHELEEANAELAALNEELETMNQLLLSTNGELSGAKDYLLSQKQFIEKVINTAKAIIVGLDTDGKIVLFNAYGEELTGWRQSDAVGRDWFNNFIPRESRPGVGQVFAQIIEDSENKEYENEIITRQGRRMITWRNTLLRDGQGNITLIIATGIDITERKQAEQSLSRLASIVKHSHDAIIGKTLDGIIFSWNSGAEKIYGYTAEEAIGKNISLLAPSELREEEDLLIERANRGELIENYETTRVKKDGSTICVSITVSPVLDPQGSITGSSTIARDITEHKRAEDLLKSFSYMDGLTGIANRRQFDECLEVEWKRAARNSSPLSLILCDIDFFKNYNDTYGHLAGDDCLRKVAEAIKSTLKRPGDLATRYGGEEFAVILPETDGAGATSIAGVIRNSVENLGIPHTASAIGKVVTISLGVATLIPGADCRTSALVSLADNALYNAKQSGRNRVVTSEGAC